MLGPCCFLGTAGREWRSFERLYEEIELREQAILWCTMIVHDITTGVQGSDTPLHMYFPEWIFRWKIHRKEKYIEKEKT